MVIIRNLTQQIEIIIEQKQTFYVLGFCLFFILTYSVNMQTSRSCIFFAGAEVGFGMARYVYFLERFVSVTAIQSTTAIFEM